MVHLIARLLGNAVGFACAVWMLPGVRVGAGGESLRWEAAALAGGALGWAVVSAAVGPIAATARSVVGIRIMITSVRVLMFDPFTAVLSGFVIGCLVGVFVVLTPPLVGAVNALLIAHLLGEALNVDGFGWAVLCASVTWVVSWPLRRLSDRYLDS
ncbi:hypothetical protein [Streptomyces spongiicola]|uniref:hypothetical protein n=2 Tax=Streptomyces spongiicola TaxID=1690221 RepID=UPI0015594409|nr:hypothetical protein [Streptomyces spongiicola]